MRNSMFIKQYLYFQTASERDYILYCIYFYRGCADGVVNVWLIPQIGATNVCPAFSWSNSDQVLLLTFPTIRFLNYLQ